MTMYLKVNHSCSLCFQVPFLNTRNLRIAVLLSLVAGAFSFDCELKDKSEKDEQILKRLDPLKGKTLSVELLDKEGKRSCDFKVGICASPNSTENSVLRNTDPTFSVSFGLLKRTSISSGPNFIQLSYDGPDGNPPPECNATNRMSSIIFVCDPNTELDQLKVLQPFEKMSQCSYCSYMFEVGSRHACIVKDGLSGGSIFCILFFTGVSLYLVLGFLYQRLLVGAKGLEQIPNYNFWRDFGNLQADGCDFVCRCGPRQEAHSYRGIDERLPRDDERDDQLLNM